MFNPLPNDKILDQSKVKAFADDKDDKGNCRQEFDCYSNN